MLIKRSLHKLQEAQAKLQEEKAQQTKQAELQKAQNMEKTRKASIKNRYILFKSLLTELFRYLNERCLETRSDPVICLGLVGIRSLAYLAAESVENCKDIIMHHLNLLKPDNLTPPDITEEFARLEMNGYANRRLIKKSLDYLARLKRCKTDCLNGLLQNRELDPDTLNTVLAKHPETHSSILTELAKKLTDPELLDWIYEHKNCHIECQTTMLAKKFSDLTLLDGVYEDPNYDIKHQATIYSNDNQHTNQHACAVSDNDKQTYKNSNKRL